MATFTANITNNLRILGLSPVNRWDLMTWDIDLWDNTALLPWSMIKTVKNTFTFATDQKFNMVKKVSTSLNIGTDIGKGLQHKVESYFTLVSDIKKKPTKTVSNSVTFDFSIDQITKQSSDWSLILPGDTSNILESAQTSFTIQSISTSPFTLVTASSTIWTEV